MQCPNCGLWFTWKGMYKVIQDFGKFWVCQCSFCSKQFIKYKRGGDA